MFFKADHILIIYSLSLWKSTIIVRQLLEFLFKRLNFRWYQLGLLVQVSGLNTTQAYSGSNKIRVRCISGSDKILVGCISVLRVSDQPNRFRASFPMLFIFFVKI